MRMLLLLGVVTWHVTGSNVVAQSVEASVYDSAESLSSFTGKLVKNIAKDAPGNVVCSPISAAMVLWMAYFGAGGNTKEQLRLALELPSNDIQALRRVIPILKSLQSHNFRNVELRLVNKIYIAQDFVPKDLFMRITEVAFNSKAETVNFTNANIASRTINDWCKKQTKGRITDLITPNDLGSDTDLVLVNVAYFKGTWNKKFDVKNTILRLFNMNRFSRKPVPTMYQSGSFNWGELRNLDATFIELPYQSHDFSDAISMYIILPNKIDDFYKSETFKNLEKITFGTLDDEKMEVRNVSVLLPKFEFESSINLHEALNKENLNLTDMFTNAADFTGISSDGRRLKISKIVQKSFISVNEEGSEAASATGAIFVNKIFNNPPPYVEFNVNRPFVCKIITDSGITLFSAIISDPTANKILQAQDHRPQISRDDRNWRIVFPSD